MSDTCTAKGAGWKCDRDVQAKELCPGHYQQQRRGRELAPLDGPSGQRGGAKMTLVAVRLPPDWVEALEDEAKREGEEVAETYRRGLAPFIAKIRRK